MGRCPANVDAWRAGLGLERRGLDGGDGPAVLGRHGGCLAEDGGGEGDGGTETHLDWIFAAAAVVVGRKGNIGLDALGVRCVESGFGNKFETVIRCRFVCVRMAR